MQTNRRHTTVIAKALLPLAGLAMALVFFLAPDGGHDAAADTPHTGLDFVMSIPSAAGDCTTETDGGTCFPENSFTVDITLASLPDGVTEYRAFDAWLTYSGVTSKDSTEIVWPDCSISTEFFDPGVAAFGCAIGPGAPTSTSTGLLGSADFNCTASGAVTLVHGETNTSLTEDVGAVHAEADGLTESINITCGGTPTPAPPTPTPTLAPIQVLAGTGTQGFSGDGGPPADAELDGPRGSYEVTSPSEILYFADTGNNRIRTIQPVDPTAGTIVTFAGGGSGTCGGAEQNAIGDGCPPGDAVLDSPFDVFVASSGDVYIADTDHCLVRKASGGVITTVAGVAATAPDCGNGADGIAATSSKLNSPRGVAVDSAGNVYIADTLSCRIRKVNTSGVISTVAGSGTCGYAGDGGSATAARLNEPHDVFPLDDDLVVADTKNHRVRRIDFPAGIITTIAGNGTPGDGGDGGPATSAQLQGPEALTAADGLVLIADTQNDRIRRVFLPVGVIDTIVGPGGLTTPVALDKPAGISIGSLNIGNTGENTYQSSGVDEQGGGGDGFTPTTSCGTLPGLFTIDWALPVALLGLILFRKRISTAFIRLRAAAARPVG